MPGSKNSEETRPEAEPSGLPGQEGSGTPGRTPATAADGPDQPAAPPEAGIPPAGAPDNGASASRTGSKDGEEAGPAGTEPAPGALSSSPASADGPEPVDPSMQEAAPADPDELQRIRALLFQKEIEFIEDLRKRLADPGTRASETSDVIAEALMLRAGKDSRLQVALEPVVEEIIKASLRHNPRGFTDVLFPLMGPSIRKSIAESLRNMVDSFNKSMERSLSLQGLRWRFEALRTGQPFSEIVLLHTLVYRVEEVYFIHSETGINIAQAAAEGEESKDAGMISAMLTAIQDFVQDCFTSGGEGDLESLRHGEYTVLVERSEMAYLACIVRGQPPAGFRDQIRDCLDNLLVEFATPLAKFDGDTAPFALAGRHLEKLLVARYHEERKRSRWFMILPFLLLLILAGSYGFHSYHLYQEEKLLEQQRILSLQDREAAVQDLYDEPGLLVTTVRRNDGQAPWQVFVLKDEYARSPQEVIASGGHDPEGIWLDVRPFVSYQTEIVQKRVENSILPPEGVSVRFDEGGTLHFSGLADLEWILNARITALSVPGVKRLDMSGLTDPRMEELLTMVRQVEEASVTFPLGRTTPDEAEARKLRDIVDVIANLDKLARSMGMEASLTIYGHADATGADKRNYEISQERAKTVASMLYSRGASMPIQLYGMGADYAITGQDGVVPNEHSRRIEFRVRIFPAAEAALLPEW